MNTKQNHAISRLAREDEIFHLQEEMRRLKRAFGLLDLAVNYTNLHKKTDVRFKLFMKHCFVPLLCAFVSCGKGNYIERLCSGNNKPKNKTEKRKENLVH